MFPPVEGIPTIGYLVLSDIGIAFLVIFGPAMYVVALLATWRASKLQKENEELKRRVQ